MSTVDTGADQTTEAVEPPAAEMSMTVVLAALADPNRLALVRAIAMHGQGGCTKTAALAGLTLSKSTLSHHFRTLREAGVLHARYVGATKFLSLRSEDLETRFPGLLPAIINGG